MDGMIFDLDGTLYLGEQALPGAVETLAELRRRETPLLFLSNKPLEPAASYAAHLSRLGMPVRSEDVLTSAAVLAEVLHRTAPELRLYVLGETSLKDELQKAGLCVLAELLDQDPTAWIDPHRIDGVVVAFDRTLDYRKLNTAYQALQNGARFFATNADPACPVPGGLIPDAGATLAYLQHLTGRAPELIAGKPSPLILQAALARLERFAGRRLSPGRCWVVGDRLQTDMQMGRQAGLRTALVLSGATRREHLAGLDWQPDLVLDTVAGLLPALAAWDAPASFTLRL